MRKQYYFRVSERGLLSWEIDRLINLTKQLPRIAVPITAIRELSEPFCSEYDDAVRWRDIAEHMRLVNAADLRFPIILSADGRVMDGMHRVIKAVLENRTTIDAVQFRSDPEPDHIGLGPDDLSYEEATST